MFAKIGNGSSEESHYLVGKHQAPWWPWCIIKTFQDDRSTNEVVVVFTKIDIHSKIITTTTIIPTGIS